MRSPTSEAMCRRAEEIEEHAPPSSTTEHDGFVASERVAAGVRLRCHAGC
jgi:hypothetical protein